MLQTLVDQTSNPKKSDGQHNGVIRKKSDVSPQFKLAISYQTIRQNTFRIPVLLKKDVHLVV